MVCLTVVQIKGIFFFIIVLVLPSYLYILTSFSPFCSRITKCLWNIMKHKTLPIYPVYQERTLYSLSINVFLNLSSPTVVKKLTLLVI